MDPITLAIVAALSTGVISGAAKIGENLLVDAYTALKDALKRKLGIESGVVKAVDNLEAKPESLGRKTTLTEEVAEAKVDQDPDIRKLAQDLLDQIKSHPSGEQHIQNAIGSYIAQADRGGSASVTVNQPDS